MRHPLRAAVFAAGALAGCAPAARVPAPQPPIGHEFVADYNRIGSVVLVELGDRSEIVKEWIVLPRSVVISHGGDVIARILDARSGLLGPIVAVDADSRRIWLGTAQGVFTLDKSNDDLARFQAGSPMEDHVVAVGIDPSHPDTGWAVTRAGVMKIEHRFGRTESFVFEEPILPRAELVAMDRDFVWVGGNDGLLRFSKQWGRWDRFAYPGGSTRPLRLTVDAEARALAITENALYRYDSAFERWLRVD